MTLCFGKRIEGQDTESKRKGDSISIRQITTRHFPYIVPCFCQDITTNLQSTSMSRSTQSNNWFLLVLPIVFFAYACTDSKSGEHSEADTTAVVDSTAIHAEMDRAIADYNVATDSLAIILGELKTVEDVERLSEAILQYEARIDAFNEVSVRYGNAMLSRMESNSSQSGFERLRAERMRIDSLGEVAVKLGEVEAKKNGGTQESTEEASGASSHK